jgi:lipopolysaccharide/colanic/teichoic acid biosynthesis glycosyltransferase
MYIKILFDRLISFLGLLFLFPLLLIVAVLIKIFMPNGPIIFKQKRIGQFGKIFTMYKFRTMNVNHSGSSVSIKGESRITPLGEKLRKYKIDELLGLWNILKGDMSFVGPRPDVPGFADKLIGNDRKILEMKPGLTGPASLKYANEEEILASQEDPIKYNAEVIWPDKIRINLKYYEKRNFLLDLKIIVYTLFKKEIDF